MELSIQVRPSYLSVEISGLFDLVAAEACLRDILSAAANEGLQKILIDVRRLQGILSTADRFSIGQFVSRERLKHEVTRDVRMAFVGKDPVVEPGRLAETVAVNRGARFRVLTDLEEALDWLEVSPGERPSGTSLDDASTSG